MKSDKEKLLMKKAESLITKPHCDPKKLEKLLAEIKLLPLIERSRLINYCHSLLNGNVQK